MTFSKSGVSTSVGGKGFRVTAGPRGTYVTLGAGGISYRQRIDGYLGQTPSQSPGHTSPTPPTYSPGTPIETADASQLRPISSAETLEQLNAVSRQPRYTALVAAGGSVATIGLLMAQSLTPINYILAALIGIATLWGSAAVKRKDTERCTFHLRYEFDGDAQRRFDLLNQSVVSMGRTQKLWRIITHDPTYDWKRNAGASSLLTRNAASVQPRMAPSIASNVTPYCLDIGAQQFFFFPDRVYVHQNGSYGVVEYAGVTTGVGQTQFIEMDGVPSDSQVVGQTWRYVNKNGTPDRRFNNNFQIPIALYGVVELRSGSGLNLLFHVSSVLAAQQFVSQFHTFQGHGRQRSEPPPGYRANSGQQQNNEQGRGGEEQTRTRQRRRTTAEPPAAQPQSSSCYKVLGLMPGCTQEEAAAKYRELVKAYHPDRVNHMAPEFVALASEKLKAINAAYDELKQIKGW